MTADQAAAIERLRETLRWREAAGYEGQSVTISWGDAQWLAALAEHPADDCESVTREWLHAVGGELEDHQKKVRFRRDGDCGGLGIGLWDVDDGFKAMLFVSEQFQVFIVRGLKTRGDVRRLCRALQIPLTEETAT